MPQTQNISQQAYEAYRDLINYKLATPPRRILEDAYGRKLDQPHEQEYRREKLFVMSHNFLIWMNTLDQTNFRRLITAIQAYANRTHQLTNNEE
jgi:hypothetical protein